MIPWFELHSFNIGPITIQVWGTLVALGFLVGAYISSRRAKSQGLDPKIVWDMAFWIFVSAIIGSRIFHVLFYEPAYYFANPMDIVNPFNPGFAIMGGFLGAALAVWWFVRKRKLNFLKYADSLIWGLPWGCFIGRLGCFFIHDHPGVTTFFFGAVKYPDGFMRHDLGLYLSMLGLLIGIIFLIMDRSINAGHQTPDAGQNKGFWFGSFLVLYGISRFLLDFLRIIDTRWAGLTSTQWILIATTALGVWLVVRALRSVKSNFT
ncbi:MAG: prolipoprotein diacylglyceryl transferase [Patescibacteria group bacterium]|nr:prolipoprotein diacylglyceryl transferase [Patescibacteria group bacterium]MBU2509317.1 prolipoprotein diacylglyceryl transferase [Patescibacteria group bacterium]